MLYIREGEKVPLPKRYHAINNLCAIIYDQLTETFNGSLYQPMSKTHIELDGVDEQLMDKIRKDDVHVLDWLRENDRKSDIVIVLTKHVTMTLLQDFLNFIYESLSCAKKGKMSVAYALLRKPLTDELLIFEQLLGDSSEFIERFFHDGTPTAYDPSNKGIDKESIIKEAVSKIKPKFFFDYEFIYRLRYDKSYENGINSITNQALHIVTNDSNYRTSRQNLNFIFSIKEDYEYYFEHYYRFVPYLIFYAVAVIDEVIFNLLPESELKSNTRAVKKFRRIIGQVLLTELNGLGSRKNNTLLFKDFAKHLIFECGECSRSTRFKRKDFEFFYDTEDFLCSYCNHTLLPTYKSASLIRKLVESME